MEKAIIFLVLLVFSVQINAQDFYVKVQSETANVWNGKKVTIVQDMYFQTPSNKLVSHFKKPQEYFYTSNLKGEASFYYPATNTVKLIHDLFLSSKNNILYYYVNNSIGDMGLQEAGFMLIASRQEGSQNISEWKAPLDMLQQIIKVEMVHENYLPKYMAYYSPKGEIIKKIYYADYQQYDRFILPMRILEIEYKNSQDSVMHSQVFKQVETSYTPFDANFDFKVPIDAKLEKN